MEESPHVIISGALRDGVDHARFVRVNRQSTDWTFESSVGDHWLAVSVSSVVDDCCHDHNRDEQKRALSRDTHQERRNFKPKTTTRTTITASGKKPRRTRAAGSLSAILPRGLAFLWVSVGFYGS